MSARRPPRARAAAARRRVEPVEVRARLAEPPSLQRIADAEGAADERVQVGPADDDVAPMVDRRACGGLELVEHGGVHERQRAPRAPGAERPLAELVAVALEPAADERARLGGPDGPAPPRRARARSPRRRRARLAAARRDQSAMSSAAGTAPPRISSVVPAGSKTTPDGMPNMTTAARPSPSLRGRQAIHGPAHANCCAASMGTSPSPRPASHARRSTSSSGTSRAGTPRMLATQAASVERSVWLAHRGESMRSALASRPDVPARRHRARRAPAQRRPVRRPRGPEPRGEPCARSAPADRRRCCAASPPPRSAARRRATSSASPGRRVPASRRCCRS